MYVHVKVAVIYDGETERVCRLALAAARGARVARGEVRLRRLGRLPWSETTYAPPALVRMLRLTERVPEASPADLEWADVALFGMAMPYGVVLDRLTRFIDATVPLWQGGKLTGKVYGAFSAAATAHGGRDHRLVSLTDVFHHWGGIIVPLRGRDPIGPRRCDADGASTSESPRAWRDAEVDAAWRQGRRATETAHALKAGHQLHADVA